LTLATALLAELNLRQRVVTGDAAFCQRALSEQVVAQGGDYFWVVKDNQPTLVADLLLVFADPPPGEPIAVNLRFGRHGDREEVRLLQTSTALVGYTDWPHLGSACTIQRVRSHKGKTSYEQQYAVTSLTPARADAARLQALWRGHWGIENGLHWVRDVSFGEDGNPIRTGNGPRGMAAVRNVVISVLRRAGHTNIAAALRTYAGRPQEALALLGAL
jgi:predicted transposase YbfD/YdcC